MLPHKGAAMRDDRGKLRRNDQDVTATVQTTDADEVAAEVLRIFQTLFRSAGADKLERAFLDTGRLYSGRHPRYFPCDTGYHDLQHVLEVTLAMARLMDGYQRARRDTEAPLTSELFIVGVVAALFHDCGYLRKRTDHHARHGAEYTTTHVSRSAAFLRSYADELGLGPLAQVASALVHYTGYERPAEKIRVSSALKRCLGQMLGTADIIAQMSDRCYLEKCRDRLYPELVLGRLAAERHGTRAPLPAFASGEDLVRKTPGFYETAAMRLDRQLAGAYAYAARHFGGPNLYLEAMQKNVTYAQSMARSGSARLRRRPPDTLVPGVEPCPRDLLQASCDFNRA
ncbi:MAG TPA: hypothetical protein VG591_09390 [Burkholderiales bacterium]|jgi:hypothetical protein|nr:hypothetical protein [Burkholderiales bacterium]